MTVRINVTDFNLPVTLESGQAFRWRRMADGWFCGVVGNRFCRVRQIGSMLEGDVDAHYLALDRSLREIVATFPDVPLLRAAVQRYWGLRILRQEPWETLASFIASSVKRIAQICQVVEELVARWGEAGAFPSAAVIARAELAELEACKLGFRAKYLQAAARAVDSGRLDLASLSRMELPRAREELLKLPGVGPKIADCVLLFSCGHDAAFPVDVWVQRALRRTGLRPADCGPFAGWAQQYLFVYERARSRQPLFDAGS